jgi:hypothetical protein
MDAVVLVCERGESTYIGLCPLVCRLVANDAASSRASAADTDEVVADRRQTDVLPLHRFVVARRVVARRREVQSEFWRPHPDQRFH